jgi:hypothetical protein
LVARVVSLLDEWDHSSVAEVNVDTPLGDEITEMRRLVASLVDLDGD